MGTMRAAVIDKAGPPEIFQIVEVPAPTPKDSEIIVRQKYAAVNHGDVIRRRRGLFPPDTSPPYILGFEGAGVVESVGSAVTAFRPGDRVAYLLDRGGYAEFVAVPDTRAWGLPPTVRDEEAAGITCVGLTAWGLTEQSGIRPGETALVHGAAGGVGSVLIQILEAKGVRAIALVTGRKKQEFVKQLGAKVVLDRMSANVANEITAICPGGVNAIFDCVGQDVLEVNVAVIKAGGTWMYYGSTSGHPRFPGDRVLMNRLSIHGFVVFDFAGNPIDWMQGTAFLSSSLANSIIRAQTTEVVPLDRVSEAHRRLEARSVMGKVLLRL